MASSSKEVIRPDCIPNELVFDEILTRLPVKSLCRFKCVSKTWSLHISSEWFIKTHLLLYSPNFPRIMLNTSRPHDHLMHCSTHSLFYENHVTKAFHVDFIADNKMIVGSCNGILCVFVGDFQEFEFFLWNPSTRKDMILPPAHVDGDMVDAEFGFGYDESKDEYLLLLIAAMGNGEFRSHSKLYRSRTNSWKRIGDFDLGYPVYCGHHCKFVDRKFHIPTCPEDSFDFENQEFAVVFDIISFDIDKEEYGVIKHPEYGDHVKGLSLEELGGSLCVLCNKGTHTDLWVMKEYGNVESWTKTLTLCYNSVYSKPLIISQSGEMLLLYETRYTGDLNDRKYFVLYDPNRNIERIPECYGFDTFTEAEVYVESLVWPIVDLVE